MRRTDPLILGGGPAGSAAAITLARGGAKPTILERSRETGDAICGGFLSWRTLATLRTLGLEADQLGGHPVHNVALFAGTRRATAPLPGGAIGLSRRRLDTLLLARAAIDGAAVERGVTVKSLESEQRVLLLDGSAHSADSIFLATGKHDVRGVLRPRTAADPTMGLRVRLAPHPKLALMMGDQIELHLFDGGYAGIMLQEDGSANACLAVRKSRLSACGGDPAQLLGLLARENPAFGDRMAFMGASDSIDAIAAVPYGWRTAETLPGLFRLGDQSAVIPSLAGEGNGIALASGVMAAEQWLSGGARAAQPFQRAFAARTRRPVGVARLLWHLSEHEVPAAFGTGILRGIPQFAGLLATLTRIDH